MKRRLAISGLCTLALVGVWLTAPVARINETSFQGIRHGMREVEVTALIGVSPGNYVTTFTVFMASADDFLVPKPTAVCKGWRGNDGKITVWFDDHGLVARKVFQHAFYQEESFFARIRRWIGI